MYREVQLLPVTAFVSQSRFLRISYLSCSSGGASVFYEFYEPPKTPFSNPSCIGVVGKEVERGLKSVKELMLPTTGVKALFLRTLALKFFPIEDLYGPFSSEWARSFR